MKRPRSWLSLFISLLSVIGLVVTTYLIAPSQAISLSVIKIPILIPIALLVFLFISTLLYFIFKSQVHAILGGLFVTSFLLLRVNNFTYPLFIVLLAAFFLLLEFIFYKKK